MTGCLPEVQQVAVCQSCLRHSLLVVEPNITANALVLTPRNSRSLLHCFADSCPVSCIYWVKHEELPALEYVMQNRVERLNVGVMMAGQGMVADVFSATASFMKERRRKEEEQMRAKRAYTPAQEAARR